MPLITLTTDFGIDDPFVGLMKGVIYQRAPQVGIVDLTHNVPPQDVLWGALMLESVVDVFPPDAIHVAVVDPGVGSARKAVAVQTGNGIFIAPDNGVLELALATTTVHQIVELSNRQFHRASVSSTFHGRDVFASAAGHLAAGVAMDELGTKLDALTPLGAPQPVVQPETITGSVLAWDHFGNLVSNIRGDDLRQWLGDTATGRVRVRAGETEIRGLSQTFADVAPGQLLAYVGSLGRLEIGCRDGNARDKLRAQRGDAITLTR